MSSTKLDDDDIALACVIFLIRGRSVTREEVQNANRVAGGSSDFQGYTTHMTRCVVEQRK